MARAYGWLLVAKALCRSVAFPQVTGDITEMTVAHLHSSLVAPIFRVPPQGIWSAWLPSPLAGATAHPAHARLLARSAGVAIRVHRTVAGITQATCSLALRALARSIATFAFLLHANLRKNLGLLHSLLMTGQIQG
jgi:hypothetical protein